MGFVTSFFGSVADMTYVLSGAGLGAIIVCFIVVGLVLAYGIWALQQLWLVCRRLFMGEQVCMAVVTLKEHAPAETVREPVLVVLGPAYPPRQVTQEVYKPERWILGVRVGDHHDIVDVDRRLYKATNKDDQVLVRFTQRRKNGRVRIKSLA